MRLIFFVFFSFSYLLSDAHIFVYHRFGDNKHHSTNTSIKELAYEFEYFKTHNYKVVPLEYILKKIKNNKVIPDKWIALTIDDSYKSFYKNGFKIFKKYNYPFTLFVYVEATNRHFGDFMSWDEIKEVNKFGSIGLHSYAHPRLLNLTKKEIINDTQKGIKIFKDNMGYSPKYYAYPYGEYDDRVKRVITQFGFIAIFNQNIGTVDKTSNIYDLNRIALVGDVKIKEKLKYKTLKVKWIKPNHFPKDGILKEVRAKVDSKIKKLKLYITGDGWRDIKVKNGLVDEQLHIYLKKARTRIILGTDVWTISNKIIIKDSK